MNKIDSFEDACQLLGIDPTKLPEVSHLPVDEQQPTIDGYKLRIIIKAYNYDVEKKQHWSPDWNTYEEKWSPFFYLNDRKGSPGFRFVVSSCDLTCSYVGSRLCFRRKSDSDDAANKFIDLYKSVMTFPK